MSSGEPIQNRYDFSILFDVENGNPNGDPDAGNMPRIDSETGIGIVTDVAIKRKIRDYVELVKGDQSPWRLYIQNQKTLNQLDKEALESVGMKPGAKVADVIKTLKKDDPGKDREILSYMCKTFFDIRTFGAVMTTFVTGGFSSGQVRGPVQLGFAKSIDAITPQNISISRIAVTTDKDKETKNNTFGNKYIIPYGLYRMDGFVNAKLAEKTTGFSNEDLTLLWDAILNMFEFDRSAVRGKMAVRKLFVFKHSGALGDAPSYKLFDSISIKKKEQVESPRAFSDYIVSFRRETIPETVEVTEKVDGLNE